jgi:4-carboxymuconolactone decarboxylase
MLTESQASLFRKLAIGDDALMTSLFSGADHAPGPLDGRTSSLLRLAALVVADAGAPAYQREVRDAMAAGASPDEAIAVLVAIARVAGSALVMSAAPKLAIALGYDVDAGLEDAGAREGPE